MADPYYYQLLHVNPDASIEQVRESYHMEAKKNHPDLYPEEQRPLQQLKMMKINEAYMQLVSEFRSSKPRRARCRTVSKSYTSAKRMSPDRSKNQVGFLKDPAYTYYKLGFFYFKKGYSELYKKDEWTIRKYTPQKQFYNEHILRLAINALHYFSRSYGYYLTVVNNYPDSIWIMDSKAKLRRIERFNTIYTKICGNLSKVLHELKHETEYPSSKLKTSKCA